MYVHQQVRAYLQLHSLIEHLHVEAIAALPTPPSPIVTVRLRSILLLKVSCSIFQYFSECSAAARSGVVVMPLSDHLGEYLGEYLDEYLRRF